MRAFAAFLIVAAAVVAQTATPLSFEVASIKPVLPPSGRMRGNRVLEDRLDYPFATLRFCIGTAYGVKDYQISGPAWLADAHWQIDAKAPQGTTREKIPEMLRTLLAERFNLQAHVEKREFDGFALVVGKNGPNLEPAAADPAGISFDRTFRFGGGGRVASPSMSMAAVANMNSGILGRPVADETGLQGNYKVAFEYSLEETQDGGLRPVGRPPAASNAEPSPSVLTSVQTLGLKLEPRRVSLEMVVAERAENTPTEN